ncbi:hypothetical protein HALO32_03218 [Halomonas lysinitropha]|uniref:Uncharacterized protein n=1 Tax=Halomonas lysinitropha TaxID=2607506 RepID=A0A5K1IBN8_9GAMM|nr:hypothetical protein HALO32_03218 [Halomonas lysinitropha]
MAAGGEQVWHALVPSAGINLIRFNGFGRTDLSPRVRRIGVPGLPDKSC